MGSNPQGESRDYVIEVSAGQGEPPQIGLSPGQVIGPLSFGSGGTWRIVGAGVAHEHGYLYYDGATLFLRSADLVPPVIADGRPVPAAWTPISPPSHVRVGSVLVTYDEFESPQERTVDRYPAPSGKGSASKLSLPPPGPTSRGASSAGASRGSQSPPAARSVVAPSQAPVIKARSQGPARPADPEVTRLETVDQILKRAQAAKANAARAEAVAPVEPISVPGPPKLPTFVEDPSVPAGSGPLSFGGAPVPTGGAAPSFGAPPGSVAPSFGPPPSVAPVAPSAALPPAKVGPLGKWWKESSGPQKATVFLFPLLCASVWIIFVDEPVEDTEPRPTAAASSSASPSASAPAALASAPPVASDRALSLGADPMPSASAVGSGSAAPARPAPAPVPSGERTLERKAADAVATGDFKEAARLYAELAKERPSEEAFSEAARIMEAKARQQAAEPSRP